MKLGKTQKQKHLLASRISTLAIFGDSSDIPVIIHHGYDYEDVKEVHAMVRSPSKMAMDDVHVSPLEEIEGGHTFKAGGVVFRMIKIGPEHLGAKVTHVFVDEYHDEESERKASDVSKRYERHMELKEKFENVLEACCKDIHGEDYSSTPVDWRELPFEVVESDSTEVEG